MGKSNARNSELLTKRKIFIHCHEFILALLRQLLSPNAPRKKMLTTKCPLFLRELSTAIVLTLHNPPNFSPKTLGALPTVQALLSLLLTNSKFASICRIFFDSPTFPLTPIRCLMVPRNSVFAHNGLNSYSQYIQYALLLIQIPATIRRDVLLPHSPT